MTKQEQIDAINNDMKGIARLMKDFVPDSHDYVKSFDEWLDSTRDGVQYHGRWIKASIAIKYAMPDVYARDLEQYTNEKFIQDKLNIVKKINTLLTHFLFYKDRLNFLIYSF